MIAGNDIVYDFAEYTSTISNLNQKLDSLKEERLKAKSLQKKLTIEYEMITIKNLINGFIREYTREFF